MEKSLAHRFAAQTTAPDLVEILAEQLSASELNTVLLEVFRRRAQALSPAEVLRHYRQNRFVQSARPDPLAFRKFETGLLQLARARGFEALELSPLSPLGACSAVAAVPQHAFVANVAAEARERDWDIEMQHLTPDAQPYYRILQDKIAAWIGGQEVEIADSGFTDWTQRLSGNRKERFLISGLGSELLFYLQG